MNAKDHFDDERHFVSCVIKLNRDVIGIEYQDELFGPLQQFEVVLDDGDEELIDVDVDQFDGSQYFEGSIEDLIDGDEQLSPQKAADALDGVFQLVAPEVVEIEFSHDLAYSILTL